jgi:hypothetical protein
MGVAPSTVSRLLSEHLGKLAQVLAHAGLKVVPESVGCYDPKDIEALKILAERGMAALVQKDIDQWE